MKLSAVNLHNRIVEFIDKNYSSVLDNGLMDDILVNEYRASVAKITNSSTILELERLKLIKWLDFILCQMIGCAKDNMNSGNNKQVFKDFLDFVNVNRSVE